MNPLLDRLTEQLKEKGRINPRDLARKILWERGHLVQGTDELTAEGRTRASMSAEDRAIDRQVKHRGGKHSQYRYNPKTNTVRKIKYKY